jgi:hypothetical protein
MRDLLILAIHLLVTLAKLWDLPDAEPGGFDPHAQPAPEVAFDQRITW